MSQISLQDIFKMAAKIVTYNLAIGYNSEIYKHIDLAEIQE